MIENVRREIHRLLQKLYRRSCVFGHFSRNLSLFTPDSGENSLTRAALSRIHAVEKMANVWE
jgi:hypothetical protein